MNGSCRCHPGFSIRDDLFQGLAAVEVIDTKEQIVNRVLHRDAPASHQAGGTFPAAWSSSISPLEQPEGAFDQQAFEMQGRRPWLSEEATDALLALVCVAGCAVLAWLGAFPG